MQSHQDLLPLYHDGVASPDTAALVEEHLKDCEACQEVFHRLQDASSLPLPVSGKEERKAEGLAKVKKALRKKRVIVVSIVAAVVLVLGVSAGLLMNMRFLSAGLDALESISVKEDTLTINLKDDRWTGVLGYSSMYLEENGELVPIVVVDVTATPADYLWGPAQSSVQKRSHLSKRQLFAAVPFRWGIPPGMRGAGL